MSTYTASLAALTHDFLFTAIGEGVTILQAWETLNVVLPRPYNTRLKAVLREEEETKLLLTTRPASDNSDNLITHGADAPPLLIILC